MSISDWVYIIYFILSFVAIHVGLWRIFEKAGEAGWKALVPFYNYWILLKITGKPKWWFILGLIPIVNLVMPFLLFVEICKVFGKDKFWEQTVSMLFPYIYLPIIGFDKSQYIGPVTKENRQKRGMGREWADAIVFALIAATFIRTMFVEPYKIPTPSMEGTMLVGDHLFVSKFHYGARIPITPLAFPLAHHTIPVLNTKAFVDWIQLPYYRLPALQKIKRNDIVVFNFPEGDTVVTKRQNESYYSIKRQNGGRQMPSSLITVRPMDKMDNYVKRCVAIPGDVLQVINGDLHINGERAEDPLHKQASYNVYVKNRIGSLDAFKKLGIRVSDVNVGDHIHPVHGHIYNYQLSTSNAIADKIREMALVLDVEKVDFSGDNNSSRRYFPNNSKYYPEFAIDNYGPITMPKKGETISLTPKNLPIYKRLITIYEGNELKVEKGELWINGENTLNYTFKYDYYFMMGDNRHNSMDSRTWGFVPETHIVGKPWFVWFSIDDEKGGLGGIRWNRILTSIK